MTWLTRRSRRISTASDNLKDALQLAFASNHKACKVYVRRRRPAGAGHGRGNGICGRLPPGFRDRGMGGNRSQQMLARPKVCWYSRTMTSGPKSCEVRQTDCDPPRRTLLAVGLGLGLAPWLTRAADADDPTTIPPQSGDQFVFLTGEKKGQVIKADDLPLGGPQFQAYPIDPKSRVVRDGSLLNLIVLIRLDRSLLSEETRTRAAEGVVAYSAVCTHQGCPVNMWTSAQNALFCSCHGSVYDPRNAAQVLDGPAPRRLPSLGLTLEDGVPAVVAKFSGRVGPTTQGL